MSGRDEREHWQDHYAELEIPPDASQEEIRAAYRAKIKEFHPDRVPPDASAGVRKLAEEKTKAVNFAYQVLGDAESRALYDEQRKQRHTAHEPPNPVVDPAVVRFVDVPVGSVRTGRFVIRNDGGVWENLRIPRPIEPWLKITGTQPLNSNNTLPLQVELEVMGRDPGKTYWTQIEISLDGITTTVTIELQTRAEVATSTRSWTPPVDAPTSPPPTPSTDPVHRSGSSFRWAVWIMGFAMVTCVCLLVIGSVMEAGEQESDLEKYVDLEGFRGANMLEPTEFVDVIGLEFADGELRTHVSVPSINDSGYSHSSCLIDADTGERVYSDTFVTTGQDSGRTYGYLLFLDAAGFYAQVKPAFKYGCDSMYAAVGLPLREYLIANADATITSDAVIVPSWPVLWSKTFDDPVTAVAFSPDQAVILAGTKRARSVHESGQVALFDVDSTLRWTKDLENQGVTDLFVTSAGKEAMVVARRSLIERHEGNVMKLDNHGDLIWNVDHSRRLQAAAGSPDDNYWALIRNLGLIGIDHVELHRSGSGELSVSEGTGLWSIQLDKTDDVAISAGGQYVAAIGPQIPGRPLWNSADGLRFFNKDGDLLWSHDSSGAAMSTRTHFVTLASDASRVAASHSSTSSVHVLDADGELLWTYDAGTSVTGLSLSADGDRLAITTDGGQVLVLGAEGQLISELHFTTTSATRPNDDAVAISADGQLVVLGLGPNLVLLDVSLQQ